MAIYNDRNTMLTTAASRITGASVSITNNFGNQLLVPKNSAVPYPQNIQLTAVTSKYFSPQYTWSYKIGTGSYTGLGLTTATINLTLDATWLEAVGTNTTVTYKVEVAETAGSYGINATQAEFVVPVIREGADGTSAWNNVPLRIYRRNTINSAPELLTTGNSVYTFSSGVLIGIPSGWSTTVPSTGGEYVFAAEYTAVSQINSVTFANTNWSTPALFVKDGAAGATGNSGVVVYAYKRSDTVPTDNPGQVVYSFTTNTITTDPLANSWSKSIPSGTDPLYAVTATASSNSGTDTILSSEWSNPVELVRNGTAGTNVATVYLYARNNNSGSAPAFVTDGLSELVFNFTQGNLSGTPPTNWYLSPPDVSLGSVLWLKTAVAFGTGTTDNIAWLNWSDAKVLSVNGANGAPGASGVRGSRTLYSSDAAYTSTYTYGGQSAGANSYAAKATELIAAATAGSVPTTPINGDTVTFSNGTTYVFTLTHNGTSWQTPGVVIDGSLLVTGSVTAAKIDSSGLKVRAPNGDSILEAGLDAESSYVAVGTLESLSYSQGSGTTAGSGWRIDKAGNAVFENALLRGTIYAADGQFSGSLRGANIEGTTGTFTGILSASSLLQSNKVGTSKEYFGTYVGNPGSVWNTFTIATTANAYLQKEFDIVNTDKVLIKLWAGGGGGGGGGTNINGTGGSGGGGGGYTEVTATLTNNLLYVISAATNASPCVLTTTNNHNLSTGDRVTFINMPSNFNQLNNTFFWVEKLTNTTFRIYSDISRAVPVNSGSWGAYTSGGQLWPRIDSFNLVVGAGGQGAQSHWDSGIPGGGTYIQHFKNGSGTPFATYSAAGGGGGGASGGSGGSGGTGGTVNGSAGETATSDPGGRGANAVFGVGVGGAGGATFGAIGSNATPYAAGGGGAYRKASIGGNGSPGKASVEYYSSAVAVSRSEFADLIAQLQAKLGFIYTPYPYV